MRPTTLKFSFNPKKSTQAAALLLSLNGGDMDKYLWIKMLYWADREAIAKWQEPITGDVPVSAPYGQILGTIYDLTKGDCQTLRQYWEQFISDADTETNRITLKSEPGVNELSKAEIAILKATHAKFKDFTFERTKNFFAALAEHENVAKGTSKPLPMESIFRAVGKSDADIKKAEERCRQTKLAELLLGRA